MGVDDPLFAMFFFQGLELPDWLRDLLLERLYMASTVCDGAYIHSYTFFIERTD